MQGYLQTQLTTEILAVELAQSTSKFIGIKDHQILIGYMKVNDEKRCYRDSTDLSAQRLSKQRVKGNGYSMKRIVMLKQKQKTLFTFDCL